MTSSVPAQRGRPRSVEADRAILQAAVTSLIEDGYAGLTMAGVAHHAGVSTATLYRRFHDKDELVIASLEEMGDRRAAPDTGSLEGDIRALLNGLVVALAGDGGRILEGLISETARNRALGEKIRSRLGHRQRDVFRIVFERALERGEVAEIGDLDILENLIAGPLFHRLLISVEPITPAVVDTLVPMLVRAVGITHPD